MLDSIKNPYVRAFAWRCYNTFVASIFPLAGAAIGLYFADNNLPVALSSFLNVGLWDYVLGAVVLSLVTGSIAGVQKATRVITQD